MDRQIRQAPGQACDEFVNAMHQLGAGRGIPRFDLISKRLKPAKDWEIVAVTGLIPEQAFFALPAQRRYAVAVWLRRPEDFDYIVEPDVFDDLLGLAPLLFDPVLADDMQGIRSG